MRNVGLFCSIALPAACLATAAPAVAQSHEREGPPPWSQAEEVYDPAEMARAREHALMEMGGMNQTMIMADRFELQDIDGDGALVWDGDFWTGGDINRLWFKSEGEYSFEEDQFEEGDIQALWSRAITAFWDFQAGVRYDFAPDGRTYAVAGFQGLAPYLFEVDAAAYLSTDGDLSASIESEYELKLTQRLILQPRVEVGLAAQSDPSRNMGAGFTEASLGARLRYEFTREFAPYVGVEWRNKLGETRDIAEAMGEDGSSVAAVVGLRMWY